MVERQEELREDNDKAGGGRVPGFILHNLFTLTCFKVKNSCITHEGIYGLIEYEEVTVIICSSGSLQKKRAK